MKKKRLLAGLLLLSVILTSTGCANLVEGLSLGSSLKLWYEASTVKIKQDDQGEAVKQSKDKSTLLINMARNESEGVQLMMYAKKEIGAYQVSVSDLKSKNGIIPSESVDIYQVKYQLAEGNSAQGNPDFAGGYLPDPLLPIETAIEYGETTIEAGKNQSIYLDVTTEDSTPAGVYEGKVTVIADKKRYRIPIEVTVHDVTLPDSSDLKTAFSIFSRDHYTSAELDGTDAQATIYYETMLKYNMCSALPYEGIGGKTAYLEQLRKYYNYDGFNSYRLFYQVAATAYEERITTYNVALLKEYIMSIADMSIEDQINYLDKAYAFFYTVADEPVEPIQFQIAKDAIDIYTEMLRDADTELRAKYAGTPEYQYYNSVISETLLHIPNVLAGWFNMEQVEYYGIENYTFVPRIDYLNTTSDIQNYRAGRENMELWTYSCNNPVYPYPSGHIDDYSLGFRLTSWMCYDYDLSGYLYWGSVNYINREGGETNDPWETMDTGFGRPGEARFFYPGEKYGLDAPCPSLRAMAYRDGVDDYSLLQEVQNIYDKYELDANVALQEVYEKLYTGVIPITDSYAFEEVRASVFTLLSELQSDTGIVYATSEVNFDEAQVGFKTVNKKAVVEVDGKEIKADENGTYMFKVDLTKESSLSFTVTCGKEEKTYTRELLTGKLDVAEGFEDIANPDSVFTSSAAGYAVSINEDKTYVKDGNKSVHISINKEQTQTLPYFAIIKESALLNNNLESIKSMQFYVYNAGEKDIELNATYFTTSESSISYITLPAGEWTKVEIPIPLDVEDVTAITEFDFNFPEGSVVDIYIDSFATVVEK